VFNGRFKGGHITRHYGNPAGGVHAIQLEMCQCLYMDEAAPFGYRPDLAAEVQPVLRKLLGHGAGMGAPVNALFARRALLPEGWRRDVLLEWDAQGDLAAVTPDAAAPAGAGRPATSCPAWSTCTRTPSSARWAA
jgi:hypothetical protein